MIIKALSRRERIIFYATAGMIIFSLAFNLLIEPALRRNNTLNKEITLAKTRLKKYLRLLSQKSEIQEKYNKLFAYSRASQKEDAQESALSGLDNLARASGIRVLDIRPQGTGPGGAAEKATIITLRAEGAPEAYIRFIYAIENSPLLLRVRKFQLTAKSNTQDLEGLFSVSQVAPAGLSAP